MDQEAENDRARMGGNNPPLSLPERLALNYETLSERVADILTKARDEIPTEIKTDEENSKIGDIVKGIRSILRDIETSKDTEKRPHLDANRDIEAFFKSLAERLTKGRDVIERRGKTYLDQKAADERRRREEAAAAAADEADRKFREAQTAEEVGKTVHAEIALDQAAAADSRAELARAAAEERPADLARTRLAGGGVSTLKTEWNFEITDREKIPLDRIGHFFADAEISKAVRAFVKGGGRSLPGVRIFEDTKAQYR